MHPPPPTKSVRLEATGIPSSLTESQDGTATPPPPSLLFLPLRQVPTIEITLVRSAQLSEKLTGKQPPEDQCKEVNTMSSLNFCSFLSNIQSQNPMISVQSWMFETERKGE